MPRFSISWRLLLWIAWGVGLAVLAGLTLYPLSTGWTRAAGAVLSGCLWVSFLLLLWHRRRIRFGGLGISLAAMIFLAIPGGELGGGEARMKALRADYVKAMSRYEGARYYWGGESPCGIDCSGLIRRGMIEALLWDGIRWLKPRLVREAIAIWWNDTSAQGFVLGAGDRTRFILSARSLNSLDGRELALGDLAVTANGMHVLAYAGDRQWIEADPAAWRVMTIAAPGPPDGWLGTPVNVVRWRILDEIPRSNFHRS